MQWLDEQKYREITQKENTEMERTRIKNRKQYRRLRLLEQENLKMNVGRDR